MNPLGLDYAVLRDLEDKFADGDRSVLDELNGLEKKIYEETMDLSRDLFRTDAPFNHRYDR